MSRPSLTLGSLFDGSGGFPLGGLLCGIKPLWASEVEPFPIRVTTKRLPNVKHYGDVRRINGANVPPVSILTFGSPCQSFSLAGKREGMEGKSGLFYEAVRVIREMRAATDGLYPKFAVMENVTGIFSSKTNGKSDFLEVLNELVQTKDPTLSVPLPQGGKWSTSGEIVGDGFSLGWRTFDAQFWGVAQRRRRCYIVLHLTGECAGKVLFDESGLRWNPAPRGFPWQNPPRNPPAGAGGAVAFEPGAVARLDRGAWEETACTLRAQMGDNQLAVAFGISSYESNGMKSDNPNVGIYEADTARTLDTSGGNPACNQGGIAVVSIEGNGARPSHHGDGYSEDGVSFTLNTVEQHGVAYVMTTGSYSDIYKEICPTLQARDYKDAPVVLRPQYIVRRLTPTECALLQGFPPDWCAGLETPKPDAAEIAFWVRVWETHRSMTKSSSTPKSRDQIIAWLRDPYSDSCEYKMWGNGVALPNVVFVLGGIVKFAP